METKKGYRHDGKEYYFRNHVGWSKITSSRYSFRYYDENFTFDSAGLGLFPMDEDNLLWALAFLNSNIATFYIGLLNPTLNVTPMVVKNLPAIRNDADRGIIVELTKQNIEISKEEWDEFEISWDFKEHPLVSNRQTVPIRIEEGFCEYVTQSDQRFEKLRSNEILLNRRFVESYGLQGEVETEVEEDAVTLRKADLHREIKSLISYAVGCIMGRYSLKEDGLIYAGGEWNSTRYSDEFKPCEYGVMPITEEQYFEEDLCTRVIDFIKVVYGEDTLTENLKFIASALKPGSFEAPKKVIREYLFNGFFDNHCQIYQHRPIYWQLDSGKAGGFRAIVYMHRYSENTLPIVRTEYIQELRYKYEEEMQRLQHRVVDATTTAEKNAIKREITIIDKKLVECTAYDELLNHATSNIKNYTFDLDDGVKINYAKFLSVDGDKSKNILTVIKL